METNAIYRLRFKCPRWSGIIEFLNSEANYHSVDLKLEYSKSFLTISGSFVATGKESDIVAFKSSFERSINKYNKD